MIDLEAIKTKISDGKIDSYPQTTVNIMLYQRLQTLSNYGRCLFL